MAKNPSLNVVISASIDKLKAGLKSAVSAIKQGAPQMQAEAQKAGEAISNAMGGDNLRANAAELREQINVQRQVLGEMYKDLAAKEAALASTSKGNLARQKALKTAIAETKAEIKAETMAMRDLQSQSANTNAELANGGRVAEQNTQAAEALSRAVNAMSMAILLVADDNEALGKTMQVVRVTMALASAAVAVYNLSLRENQVLQKANIALQKAWAMVVGQTTGALRVLRVTLVSLGIGAVIAALGYLISKLTETTDATEELDNAQAHLNRSLSKSKQQYDETTRAIQRQLEADIARAQIAGKSEQAILQIRKDSLDAQIAAEKTAKIELSKLQDEAEREMVKRLKDEGKTEEQIGIEIYNLRTKQIEERNAFEERINDLKHQREMLDLNFTLDAINKADQARQQSQEEQQRLDERRLAFVQKAERDATLAVMDGIDQKRQQLAFEYADRIAQARALGVSLVATEEWYMAEQAKLDAEAEQNRVESAQRTAELLKDAQQKRFDNQFSMFETAQNMELAAEARNRAQGIIDEDTYQKRILEIQRSYLMLQIQALEAAGQEASKLRLQYEMLGIGKEIATTGEDIDKFSQQANQAFANLQVELIDEFAQSLGTLFEAGKGMKGFGNNMLRVISTFLRQLGRLMIAAGTATKTFKESLANNPGLAIAAGVAAIATAASIQAHLNNVPQFAEGGIVSGPTLGLMGEYAGAASNPEVIAPLDKLKSMIGDTGQSGFVAETRVDGRDLYIVLNRYEKDRLRG